MKKIGQYCAIAALLLLQSFSHAQSSQKPDDRMYCGSGFTEKIVPDRLFGCDMSQACKVHDACYGKCDVGGSMHGQPYCALSEFSPTRVKAKLACEAQFYKDIDLNNSSRWECRRLGAAYVGVVGIVGQGPFNGRPISRASMEQIVMTSNTDKEAQEKVKALAALSQKGIVDLNAVRRQKDSVVVDTIGGPGGLSVDLRKGAPISEIRTIKDKALAK